MSKRLESLVRKMIKQVGDDNPNREGLADTPARVSRSWGEIFSGYKQKPEEIIKSFEDGNCKELVIVRDIVFYSMCEHHMLPFFGVAHVGYLPTGRILGLGKVARLVDAFSRRLQVQERMASQIADALYNEPLEAAGVMVVTEARHLCMEMRGVRKQSSMTVVNAQRGLFDTDTALKAEFMALVQGGR